MNIDKNSVLAIIAVVGALALSTSGDRPKCFAVTAPRAAARPSAVAQQSAAQNAAPAMETYTSAADVQALIAQKKAAPLLAAAPYNVNMEYRATIGPAAVHEREAEIFYIYRGNGNDGHGR
jgi:hypothetical protein